MKNPHTNNITLTPAEGPDVPFRSCNECRHLKTKEAPNFGHVIYFVVILVLAAIAYELALHFGNLSPLISFLVAIAVVAGGIWFWFIIGVEMIMDHDKERYICESIQASAALGGTKNPAKINVHGKCRFWVEEV